MIIHIFNLLNQANYTMELLFITGIGTDIGKTIAASILTEALGANYWKPIQAGFEEGTDVGLVGKLVTNKSIVLYPEVYKLKTPTSPHIAARMEDAVIDISKIVARLPVSDNKYLIIEGAGGLMVPLNDQEFVIDLIKRLKAKVILVSKNYLGSINHSLLTAALCKQRNIPVVGWIFNQQYMDYENEIVKWSGYKKLHAIPFAEKIDSSFIREQATIFLQNNNLEL